MFFRRVITVFTFAVSFLSAVLHSDLEAAGWMIDHDHGHSHHDDANSDKSPFDVDEHESIVARQLSEQGRIFGPLLLILAVVSLLSLFEWFRNVKPQRIDCLADPRRSDHALPVNWQFVCRCAPDSTAPPALS
jgi:hypothetical protein